MDCPKCRTPTLHLLTRGASGFRLDRCDRCGGTWLDYGELVPAAEDPLLPPESPEPPPDPDADRRSGPCPRCGIALRQALAPEGGFHVDRCPRCGGIFLDRGELTAIAGKHLVDELERVFAPRPAPPAAPVPERTGLRLEDRAILARAAELATRFPEAAEFLRRHLDGKPPR